MMEDEGDGPHIAIAVLCERVMEEKDGVFSFIRIVDRIAITPGSGAPLVMPPVTIDVVAVIAFRAGRARGRHTVALRPETPSGVRLQEVGFPVLFEDDERSAQIVMNLSFPAEQEGLYWFDVLLNGRRATRISLRLVYQAVSLGATGQTP